MISRPDFMKKQILFVFTSSGEKLSFKNDNIIITEKDGNIKHQSTCYRLFMVCVVGEISITSGLIQRAQKFGFSICLMTRTMKLYEIIGFRMEGNTLLHRKQYEYDGEDVGKFIVKNKIDNQKAAIKKLRIKSDNANDVMCKLNQYSASLDNTVGLRNVLGIEGCAAKVYFHEMFSTAEWKGRKPRVKSDYINSTLDIGYTILFNFVDAMLRIYDFDIYLGVLHTSFYMRKSLVCDLMEPMRFLIDLQVRKSINYGQFKKEHFNVINHKYVLKWENSTKYTQLLVEPILKNKEAIFIYIRDYYRAVMKGLPADEYPVFEVI